MITFIQLVAAILAGIMAFNLGYSLGKGVKDKAEKAPKKDKAPFSGQDFEGTMFYFGADGKIHSIPPKPKK